MLERKVQKAWNSTAHYGKYTARCAGETLFYISARKTFLRLLRQAKEEEDIDQNTSKESQLEIESGAKTSDGEESQQKNHSQFLEDIITSSVFWGIVPPTLVTAALLPPFGLSLIGSNLVSYGIETYLQFKASSNKEKEDGEKEEKVHKRNFQECWNGIMEYVREIPKMPGKCWKATKEKVKGIPQALRDTARFVAVQSCAYAILTGIALTHYALASKEVEYDERFVNNIVHKISLTTDGNVYEFYLMGEMHTYNYSSNEFVRKLYENEGITMLDTEGVRFAPETYRKIKSMLDRLGWIDEVVAKNCGYGYPDPVDIALAKGIPIEPLELVDESTGKTEGLTDEVGVTVLALKAAEIPLKVLLAPIRYIGGIPVSKIPLPGYFDKIIPDMFGITSKRDPLMARNSVNSLKAYPEHTHLERVGRAHLPGMLREYENYGKVEILWTRPSKEE